MKLAVVLFNLGGPDSPQAVRPFLFNLFNDPAIIRLPMPLRQLVAWLISTRREKTAQAIYAHMGGASPLFPNTEKQAHALEQQLRDLGEVKCFVAMRYWHPFIEETYCRIKNYAPDMIVQLPLYPQFSTTTTASSLRQAMRALSWKCKHKTICCYPTETGFIGAMAKNIHSAYAEMENISDKKPRLLLSAHGLPEKIVKGGDPYQWQCEQTAASLVAKLGIADLDWRLCYQSRVGPMRWIGPSTESEIEQAGLDKVPVIVAPIAFVSEHSETLVELNIEYRDLAMRCEVPAYATVPAVGTSSTFIAGLAGLVRQALSDERTCISEAGGRVCPVEFSGCCQKL